jgi:hypothetical protein
MLTCHTQLLARCTLWKLRDPTPMEACAPRRARRHLQILRSQHGVFSLRMLVAHGLHRVPWLLSDIRLVGNHGLRGGGQIECSRAWVAIRVVGHGRMQQCRAGANTVPGCGRLPGSFVGPERALHANGYRREDSALLDHFLSKRENVAAAERVRHAARELLGKVGADALEMGPVVRARVDDACLLGRGRREGGR